MASDFAVPRRPPAWYHAPYKRAYGSYYDDQSAVGQVGVYTDGAGQAAAFTDFAVYPAPPANPLLPN